MNIALVPVLNIENYGVESLKTPDQGPYWDYPEEWTIYNRNAQLKNGYSGTMIPFSNGSTFYPLDSISDSDLTTLIQNLLNEIQEDEDVSLAEQLCSLEGGCALNVDNTTILLPQCCSALDDFYTWVNIFESPETNFYQGHPSPVVVTKEDKVMFEFENHNFKGESFSQKHILPRIELELDSLYQALLNANKALDVFRERIRILKEQKDWKISNLENILVFDKIPLTNTLT